jgi:hypothetical protein
LTISIALTISLRLYSVMSSILHQGGDHDNVWNQDGHDIFHSKLVQYGMDPVEEVIFHSNCSG